uniref:Protein tyrosine phosphatase type IVA 3 n=1 Tax=Laticauda laticaudata TaxID=8630 RepID=A0A8C5SK32_LATLA
NRDARAGGGGVERLGLHTPAQAGRGAGALAARTAAGSAFPAGLGIGGRPSACLGRLRGEPQKRGLSLLLLPSLPSRRPAPVSRLGGDVASRAGGPARLFLFGRGSSPAPRPDAGTRGASPPRPCGRRPARSAPGPSMLPDWPFDDGAPPPGEIVEDWLNLLKTKFREEPGCCVAVHCVAGLGRAPVLVALALIECGMKYEDAVQFIRQKRRGAFNSKQLLYLEKYRPKMRLRFRDANGHCIVQ